jgi:hypothetical protein
MLLRMNITELKTDMKRGDFIYRGTCHDCGIPVEVNAKLTEEGAINIDGGAIYKIKQGIDDRYFFKCDECFKKDKTLRNFRQCEVYSRVVGYLRPVNQWNKGKKEEYDMRKEFVNIKGATRVHAKENKN